VPLSELDFFQSRIGGIQFRFSRAGNSLQNLKNLLTIVTRTKQLNCKIAGHMNSGIVGLLGCHYLPRSDGVWAVFRALPFPSLRVPNVQEIHRSDRRQSYALLPPTCGRIVIATHTDCRVSDSEFRSASLKFSELIELKVL
jgi:hypothetical protein